MTISKKMSAAPFLGDWTKGFGYSLFVVGDGQVVVTALRSSLPQVR